MRLLALVALATVAAALPQFFQGRRKGGFTSHLLQKVDIDPAHLAAGDIGEDKITQKLDHFDAANTNTWSQNYFFNHLYAKSDVNLNILYLSGEQDGDVGFIVGIGNAVVYYAEQLNADLYSLEHRFYGGSHPTKDTTVENLKYLSSQQAIEDIAEFIRQINTKKGKTQKWIIVGGSYAGALSAWARLLHPELISGSIASSGPVLAQLDFYGYLQTVDDDFKAQGGLCYSQLGDGLEKAREMLMTVEGQASLTETFKIRPALSAYNGLSDYDKDTFFSYLVDSFMGSAQYNQPTLENECKLFTRGGPDEDPVKAFAVFGTGFDVNYTKSIDEIRGTEYKGDISTRLWLYQTCAEFGYFQSSNRGTNVFGQTQSSNSFIEYCVRLYGIPADQIQKNIDYTNQYYGERDYYAGTNVVFTHGTHDPWSFLTKKADSKHESVVIMEVDGGSHCQDIGATCLSVSSQCTANMVQIQATTLEQMKRWIDPTIVVPDHIDINDNTGKRPSAFYPAVRPQAAAMSAPSVATKLRAARSMETEEYSHRVDFKTWNKFTGKGKRRQPPPPAHVVSNAATGQDFFIQTWDHFNTSETRTFKQKWYYNNKFGSKDGPNFLMIGGEGPESAYWVQNEAVAWMTYAKEVGANVFDLEHRYYGESKLGTNDLQYLTSAQALYDVAAFIKAQSASQQLTGPWITFGGSYPGALAAWSREWFPELILGAVGSSGPVLAKNDFYEYLEVVESVIKRQSQKCYDRTNEAFDQLEKLVQTPDGRATIQEKFKLSPKWTSDPNQVISALDINNVFSALSGLYMGTVQYNDVAWKDVAALCAFFENDNVDSLTALSNLRFDSNMGYGPFALSSDYMGDLKGLKLLLNDVDGHSKLITDDELASVLWTWQTCNEFGYYQSTDYGEGIFGTPVPVNFYIIMCEEVFGVGMDHVEAGVAQTNYQYGGRYKYSTTNVVLPNGDGDPWHALGITEQGKLDKSVVPVLINGTSHCADMYGATAADPPELTAARKTALENINKWIADATPTTPTMADNYCKCGIVDDWFDNWDPLNIWVDVVIVLDTSQSMGKSLEEAKSLITSFVGAMSTDTSAPFYSRIGVIAVSDTVDVVYNLNMSSSDSLDNVQQHKIDKIDVGAAFQAALQMFADGTKASSYRANAKQLIYYLTNSAPGANMNGVDDFKTGGGIIIVNDFILEGEVADPGLQKLASANFFFTDLSDNYINSLSVFCEANCFCSPELHAFNDDDNSPRTQGNRGCYHPVNNGIPQPNAEDTCHKEGGNLVTIHDADKEFFVSGVVSIFGAKKKYWLGLQNDGVTDTWVWDDKSTNPYNSWDKASGQPNTGGNKNLCAYAVQGTGFNVLWSAQNCAAGGIIYVCESAPCSIGNKNC